MDGRLAIRYERGGASPKRVAAGAGIDRNLQIENSSEQTRDVGFDDRKRLVEGECGYGVRSVAADSRKSPHRIHRPGESAAMFGHDDFCGGAEIASPSVVPQSLPGMENFPLGGRGERGKIWEAPHPFIIIKDNGSDLSLLEHDLGDEDSVGMARATPGKITAVFTIPGEEDAAERGGVRKMIHAYGETSNA